MKRHPYLALLVTAALLGACATTPSAPTNSASSSAYAMTVTITSGDTPQTLSAQYGGPVLAYEPRAGFAVIGQPTPVSGTLQRQSVSENLHPNKGAFTIRSQRVAAQGTGGLWTDGGGGLWTDGGGGLWTDGGGGLWTDANSTLWQNLNASLWNNGEFRALPENSNTWRHIRLDTAQTLAPQRGANVTVAVIDTGIDLEHPALGAHLASARHFKDYIDDDLVPDETGSRSDAGYGHGTHVASIIMQVAPHAKILPIRVLGADGTGDAAHLASAIVHATESGAQIINLSLGAADEIPAVERAIEYANANGVLVISSAGNSNDPQLDYPALTANRHALRLSVGSVSTSDQKSGFSSYASSLKLSAPGERIWGLAPENARAAWSGTSTSTPMVAGSLALALGEQPQNDRAALTEALARTGVNLDALNNSYAGKLGVRLDAGAFLYHVTKP